MITALLAVIVLLPAAAALTGFTDIYTPWVMLLSAVCVCAACGFTTKLNKQKIFYPAVLAILMLMALFCGRLILSGGCAFWNRMGDAWTAGNGIVLSEFAIGADAAGGAGLLMFSVFAGITAALAFCALSSLGGYVMAVFTAVLTFAGMALFRSDDTFVYMVPCLLASVLMPACGGKDKRTPAAVTGRWIPVIAVSVIVLLAAGTSGMEQWAADIGREVREELHSLRYETEYTTLPEGDFTEYKEAGGQSQPALAVTMEQPEEMYLKGFTGVDFTGDVWEPLDTESIAENEDLLYWMNRNGWNPQMQFRQASALTVDSDKQEDKILQTVTVQNINACSEYMYVPYSLSTGDQLDTELIDPDKVYADGDRTYMYQVLYKGTDKIAGTLNGLKDSRNKDAEGFRQAESAYRDFVYSYYLDVPEEVSTMMEPYWSKVTEADGKSKEISNSQAQIYARAFLEEAFPEKGEAPQLTLPLEAAEGSSYQQATVTVMTLRHFGIPARYAEGYVITEEMAESMGADGTIEVDSSCAGAWAEVYHDGVGWLPVNLTPGIEDINAGLDPDAEDGDTPQEIPPKGDMIQEEPDDMNEEPEPDGGYVVSVKAVVSMTFLLIIGLIILLALIFIVRRQLLLKKRRQRWDESSVNDAVAWIFADTEHLLKRMGLDRGNGSMKELNAPAGEKFGDEYAGALDEMTDINSRAMFSSRPLDEEYRKTAQAFYEKTLECMKADAKWYRKMWMQWVLCLY